MTDPIRAALERLIARLDETTDPNGPVPAWSDSFYAARAALAQPAPPAEGEVQELVSTLMFEADAENPPTDLQWATREQLRRTADLLAQRYPQPVPVSERPWEREGWCDEQERCWCWSWAIGTWRLSRINQSIHSHCLPAHALPVPGEVEG